MLINERLGRLEDVQAQRHAIAPNLSLVQTHQPAAVAPAAPPPATASTLAGCLLNWYTNHISQTVEGKKEQNKRAEAKAAVNTMMILYQKAFKITQEPSCSDAAGVTTYRSWKDSLWIPAVMMDSAANECVHSFDNRKSTRKTTSLRKRWKQLKTSHPDAVSSLTAQFLRMKANEQIIDGCTPATHLWDAKDMS
ncbi:hypothetical protein PC129_g8148 [Phytophthora cactorum]|uniref:Uncharacterized protein n=1 Tax=Phytophthora cactorum TaxID=29920 RepID=A0A329S3B8_9STRA|nr:hypothetical protein Pcac1_g27781 [Phytophthora cactorum]KAG2824493.1 hypothetical protein PC112_g10090 [Phytophthora cactorum]KAG2826712.1 hypothetical protein PC111_g8867 [Phytophthora cactorum]KAG2857758.1 hypothetical protein PC113_g10392 [Phytophthora cactorum]KAG2907022.1 hypothetical protein PC114_g10957 [Phytophthora cactorum]